MRIVVVDYGMGNMGSIQNMLKRVGVSSVVSSDPHDLEGVDRIILPGVGAFDTGMERLGALGLTERLSEEVLIKGTKVLGVCLGMQLLMHRSEEGKLKGLGWIQGESVRFHFNNAEGTLKIPHMGWNTLRIKRSGFLFQGLDDFARFYFVHSYHVVCSHPEDVLATAEHGYPFAAAVERRNIMGVQFHPEKSHRFGMTVLKNFIEQGP